MILTMFLFLSFLVLEEMPLMYLAHCKRYAAVLFDISKWLRTA